MRGVGRGIVRMAWSGSAGRELFWALRGITETLPSASMLGIRWLAHGAQSQKNSVSADRRSRAYRVPLL